MNHTFQTIYGKENDEGEAFLFSEVEHNIKSGNYSYILVPEQYSLSTERTFINKIGVSAQSGAEVLTFSRLCRLVLSEVGPLRGNYIDNAGKHMLIKRSLQLVKDKLKYFSKSVNKRGFTGIILNIISEFKRYSVTPSDLLKASESCAEENLAKKLHDFSIILENFNSLFEEKYSNSEDNLEIVIPRISMCSFNSGTLYISYFKSFTPAEYQVIENLMQVMNVKILLCSDSLNKPSEIFETSAHTYKKLCEIAETVNSKILQPVKLKDDKIYRMGELNNLADMYFKTTAQPSSKEARRLHVLNPSSFYAEVRDAALLINYLCKKNDFKHSDFLILAGDISAYNKFIPQLFEKYGLNYFIDKKEPILKTPIYKLTTYLLEISIYGFSYERVMSIARLRLLPIPIREVDMLDNYLLAAGINYKMWKDDKQWTFNPDASIFDMELINRAKDNLLTPINDFVSAISGRKTVNDICVLIGQWLNENKISNRIQNQARALERNGKLALAAKYKGAWNSLIAQLSQMNDILGDVPITYEKFYGIFQSSAAQINVGTIPQTLDGVMISEISHFRNATAEIIIVLGVNDGTFPKNFPVYGILSDVEREELKNLNIELAPTAISKQLEERYHIFNVLRTAKSQLYLSVPKRDVEGNALSPSPIIKRLKKLFPSLRYEIFDENSAIFTQDKTAAFDTLMVKTGEKTPPDAKWNYIRKLYSARPEYDLKIRRMRELIEFSRNPERLSKSMVTKLYGKQLSLSISKLEQFNQCAFAYFMKYGLYLSPRLRANFGASDIGSALHLILATYFKNLSGGETDYGSLTYDGVQGKVNRIADEVTKTQNVMLYENSSYYRYIALKIKGIAVSAAWEIVKFYKNSSFRPYGFEISIGGKNPDIPPKIIKTENGSARFSGFIDRADSYFFEGINYISILDYKSSEKRLISEHIENGIQLQPLAYMNMLCANLENAEPAAILYMHLNDPILRFDKEPDSESLELERQKNIKLTGWATNSKKILSKLDKSAYEDNAVLSKRNVDRILESEFKDALETANERIHQSTSEIFDGTIDINPYVSKSFNACEYCDYAPICKRK